MENITQHIEALIFCSPSPISLNEIQGVLEEILGQNIDKEFLERQLNLLIEQYRDERFAFEIVPIAGAYQMLTKTAYEKSIRILLKQKSKKKLSTAALETLAIIAYKQPLSKAQIEQIRGVNSDYAIQRLLEKELIEIRGKAESIGRPLLYGTSQKFMEHFGLRRMEDLPKIKEFLPENNQIGEIQE